MRRIFFPIVFSFLSLGIFAQQGSITGTIIDPELNEGVIGASILVNETGGGTTTDFDGNFEVLLDPGAYTLTISYIGYKTIVLEEVEVADGESTVINLTMEENTAQLEEVVVVAKADRASSSILLIERKKSTLLTQSIGARELSRLGAGDAAEGLKKVVGLAVQGSKFVVVRGLGDRYNASTLNGLPVAAPNPDRRVLPYDIFPSNILSSLNVTKSFTPSLFGNFSGASIDVRTVDYPNETLLDVQFSTGFNTQVTFQEVLRDQSASDDVLGFNNTRELPSILTDYYSREVGDPGRPSFFYNSNTTVSEGEDFTEDNWFTTGFDPSFQNAAPNFGGSITYGDRFDMGSEGELGYIFNVNYSQENVNNDGFIRIFSASPDVPPRQDFTLDKDFLNTNLSAVGNFTFKINDNHSILFKNLYSHLTNNNVLETDGFYFDRQPQDVYSRRITYLSYQLFASQLFGEHSFGPRWDFNWGASYSKADAAEPDRRQISFFYDPEDRESFTYDFNFLDRAENHRFFTDLNDTDIAGKLELKYNLRRLNDDEVTFIGFGFDVQDKTRDFFLRQYNYVVRNLNRQGPTPIYDVDSRIRLDNIGFISDTTAYEISEGTQVTDTYDATLQIYAPYFTFSWQVTPGKFNINGGLRVENATQTIEFFELGQDPTIDERTKRELASNDILGALNFKLNFTENNIGRFAISRTISRPDFRELAPFEYRESFGAFRVVGNPNLENAFNYNADLRYEILSTGGGLLAVGAFGKFLDNPIVQTVEAGSNARKSFTNGVSAYVFGVEFELDRSLAFLGPWAQNFRFRTNITGLFSRITIEEEGGGGATNQTTNERPLEGASPYLINADLSYGRVAEKIAYDFTLSYNVFGRRLSGVGALGSGDQFELPVNTLNAVLEMKFGIEQRFRLQLSAANILNPLFRVEQEFFDQQELQNGNIEVIETLEMDSFRRGITFGIGLKYRIL